MSYQDQANLAQDTEFAERLGSGLATEAKAKVGVTDLAGLILRSPAEGARIFMPWVSTAPTFDSTYADGGQSAITDGMILSAIQAYWDDVEKVYFPKPPAA